MKHTESGKIFLMIEVARRYRRMTQEELAERVGVSVKVLAAWERRERLPSVEELVKVANALEVPVDFLTGRLEGSGLDRPE